MVRLVRAALGATTDNHERVDNAVAAYFTFVADNGQAYRLIFESDLRGQAEVERIVDQATDDCISAITDTITTDTGVDVERARLLASGMVGLSQVSARYWMQQSPHVSRADAIDLLSTLMWRGISRFPRQEPAALIAGRSSRAAHRHQLTTVVTDETRVAGRPPPEP